MNGFDIVNQLIGFLVGLVSSWLFWFWQINLKPDIAISPEAAYDPSDGTLGIRIVNLSRRQATDIEVFLFIAEKQGGWYDRIYVPSLKWSFIRALNPNKRKKDFWDLPRSSIIETKDGHEIVKILSENGKGERRLVLTLSATDAVSSSKIIHRRTYRRDDIQDGYFTPNSRFRIVNTEDKEVAKNTSKTARAIKPNEQGSFSSGTNKGAATIMFESQDLLSQLLSKTETLPP